MNHDQHTPLPARTITAKFSPLRLADQPAVHTRLPEHFSGVVRLTLPPATEFSMVGSVTTLFRYNQPDETPCQVEHAELIALRSRRRYPSPPYVATARWPNSPSVSRCTQPDTVVEAAAVESAEEAFTRGRDGAPDERDAKIKALHAKIGELSMEKDFLSKALGRDRPRTLCIATAAAPALARIT